jgi:hypothetical protein
VLSKGQQLFYQTLTVSPFTYANAAKNKLRASESRALFQRGKGQFWRLDVPAIPRTSSIWSQNNVSRSLVRSPARFPSHPLTLRPKRSRGGRMRFPLTQKNSTFAGKFSFSRAYMVDRTVRSRKPEGCNRVKHCEVYAAATAPLVSAANPAESKKVVSGQAEREAACGGVVNRCGATKTITITHVPAGFARLAPCGV